MKGAGLPAELALFFSVLQASTKASAKQEASAERESRATGLGREELVVSLRGVNYGF